MTSEQGDGFWKTRQKDAWNNPHAYDGTEWGDAFKVIAPKKRKMSMWWVPVLIAVLCTIFAYLAHAEPPPGAIPDSPLATWFQRLKEPHFPSACCGYHQDCWETEAKWEGDHWIALYHPDRAHPEIIRWVNINPDVVNDDDHLPDHYNMAVKAVLCAAPWNMTDHDPTEFCVVPPAQTY